jgi:hypothetical protein
VFVLLWAQQAGALGFLSPTGSSTTTISYQGRLADSGGTPVNDTVGMTFRIYNAATGGSPLWTETYPAVQISDGLFHVLLGSTTPLPQSLFSDNDTLYLGITVGADDEMTPREQLASAPWAINALSSQSSASSARAFTAVGSGYVSSTSSSWVDIPGMNISFDLDNQRNVVMVFNGGVSNLSATGDSVRFRLVVDGTPKAQVAPYFHTAGRSVPITIQWAEVLPSGTHTASVQWYVSSGTGRFGDGGASNPWEQRVLTVMTFEQ